MIGWKRKKDKGTALPKPCSSLWLRPSLGTTQKIPLACFKDYPHFFESFKQYGWKLPPVLEIRWKPIKPYLIVFNDVDDENIEWIQEVIYKIKDGEAVPPLLIEPNGDLFDGRHRAWAANSIGIKMVPTTVIK